MPGKDLPGGRGEKDRRMGTLVRGDAMPLLLSAMLFLHGMWGMAAQRRRWHDRHGVFAVCSARTSHDRQLPGRSWATAAQSFTVDNATAHRE